MLRGLLPYMATSFNKGTLLQVGSDGSKGLLNLWKIYTIDIKVVSTIVPIQISLQMEEFQLPLFFQKEI